MRLKGLFVTVGFLLLVLLPLTTATAAHNKQERNAYRIKPFTIEPYRVEPFSIIPPETPESQTNETATTQPTQRAKRTSRSRSNQVTAPPPVAPVAPPVVQQTASVPEPSVLLLCATGLFGVMAVRRKASFLR